MGLRAFLTDAASGSSVRVTASRRLDVENSRENGPWSYLSGASGTFTVPSTKRVVAVGAHASAPGATLTIGGGAAIPVPDSTGLSIEPRGNLTGPVTIVAIGTDLVFIELVE